MTKLLEEALNAVRRTSPEQQDAIAALMLDLANEGEPEEVSSDDLAAILEGEVQAARGEFATPEQIAAAFRRFER